MSVNLEKYSLYLAGYTGKRLAQHEVTTQGCIPEHHCTIHQVDEPTPVYQDDRAAQICGECGHVFLTEADLQAEDVRFRTREWQAGLRTQAEEPLDHSGAPVARPVEEITSCPLCTHSF